MIGSEGLLGVVVEVTVRLLPLPRRVELLLAAFDDVGRCADAVGHVIAAGIVPAGLEMMDAPAIRAAEAFAHCGYPLDAAALLLCEVDGLPRTSTTNWPVRARVLLAAGATSVRDRRATPTSAGACGRDASRRSRPWAGSRRTTTAWMARYPRRHLAAVLARDCGAVARVIASTSPTCSTPATATCTR